MQRDHYAKVAKKGDARKLRVGIVVSEFNSDITEAMLSGALEELREWGVTDAHITLVRVPGGFEIPLASQRLIKKQKVHVVVALGCVMKGETKHDEYISHALSHALQRLMLDTGVPIGFGVITPNTLDQARARSSGKSNKGNEAVIAALTMALC